jgi:hypothetical protein
MTSFKKMFKGIKNEHILGILGLLILGFALYKYSDNKNVHALGMTHGPATLKSSEFNNKPASMINNNMMTSMVQDVVNKPATNPSDLLPNDSNNEWAQLNPTATSELSGINLLNPTQVVGINTQGSSLRNANLQLRSEPPNPRSNTNCPWNISTIDTDKFRKGLEIGTGA